MDGVVIDLMTILNRETRRRLKIKKHRLTVVVAIDCYTRMIIGFAISTKGENTQVYNKCLENALYPWSEKLKKYGIVGGSYASGRIQEVVIDNSAVAKAASFVETLCALGIDKTVTPTQQPYLKGTIEAAFRSLNGHFHNYPGTTKSNVQARGAYDSAANAVIYDDEIEQILYEYFAVKYNNSRHSRLGCTPAEMWREATAETKVLMPPDSLQAALTFGIHEWRAISGEGIQIDRRVYQHPELAAYRLLVKKAENKKAKITRLSMIDDRIYVKHPLKHTYLEVPFSGTTLPERPTKNIMYEPQYGPDIPPHPNRKKHDQAVARNTKDARKPTTTHGSNLIESDIDDPTLTDSLPRDTNPIDFKTSDRIDKFAETSEGWRD